MVGLAVLDLWVVVGCCEFLVRGTGAACCIHDLGCMAVPMNKGTPNRDLRIV